MQLLQQKHKISAMKIEGVSDTKVLMRSLGQNYTMSAPNLSGRKGVPKTAAIVMNLGDVQKPAIVATGGYVVSS